MARRSFILPALTAFFVTALVIFLSCASGEKADGDNLDGLEQEQVVGDAGGDAPPPDDAGTATPEELSDLEGAGKDKQAANADAPPPEDLALPDEEALAKKAEDPGPKSDLEKLDTADLDGAKKPPEPVADVPVEPLAKAPQEPPPAADIPPAELVAEASVKPAPPSVPKIPENAVRRKGTKLNRFYFARKGDTPKSVSTLIYGSPGKASKLKAWNSGKWSAGKLLYYSSPVEPKDKQMQSLYKEKGIPSEEYEVKNGDTLKKIAKKMLGDKKSWKEIAVVNGLGSPDVDPGQRLAIYPKNLQATPPPGETPPVADAVQPPPATGQQAAAQTPSTPTNGTPTQDPNAPPAAASATPGFQAESQVQFAPPPPASPAPPLEAPAPRKHGVSLTRFIQQELLTIVGGLVLILMLVSLLLVNKRKKARQAAEAADEDIFNAANR